MGQIFSQKYLKIQMIVLDKLDEDGMPITENSTTNEEEFEIVRDGKDFFWQVWNHGPCSKRLLKSKAVVQLRQCHLE